MRSFVGVDEGGNPSVRQNRRRVVWQRVTWRMIGIYCMPCAREGWKQTLALMMSCPTASTPIVTIWFRLVGETESGSASKTRDERCGRRCKASTIKHIFGYHRDRFGA
jgi:hypothetical protein